MHASATDHARLADGFARNEQRAHWHDGALWFVRQKRDRMAKSLPEWERLREMAAQIKIHTLANLPEYLEQFERNATALGGRGPLGRRCRRAQSNRLRHLEDEPGATSC